MNNKKEAFKEAIDQTMNDFTGESKRNLLACIPPLPVGKLVFSEKQVNQAYKDMIDLMYKETSRHPIVTDHTYIGLLKGGAFVLHRIITMLHNGLMLRNCRIGYMGYRSYDATEQLSCCESTYPLDLKRADVDGRIVWLIDDIIDTGNTIVKAYENIMRKYNPLCLTAVSLVTKPHTIHSSIPFHRIGGLHYSGDDFLYGCGMGLDEKYRELPYIGAVNGKTK